MRENIFKIFEINTDAVATNRGFYYQYLVVLKKWIQNFITEKSEFIYSEVDDDIKEVGDKLIFTQVKCYSKYFSFHSEEIKKSIFNFFMLFLKYDDTITLEFCFHTNTSVTESEKLLKAWINDPSLKDMNIRKHCVKKINEILNSEINFRKRKKLGKKYITLSQTDEIKSASVEIKKELSSSTINKFINCIKWKFIDNNPEDAISLIFREIRSLLIHEKFQNKPISILENVFLSEIYRCSQISEKEKRVLTNSTIKNILFKTDNELESSVNHKLISLIDIKFERIANKIELLQKNQEELNTTINDLTQKVIILQNNDPFLKLAKELTLLPNAHNENIYGRESSLEDLNFLMAKTGILYISGNGGTGKTLLVQNFLLKYQNNYDHIIWINSMPSLLEAFILDEILIFNLNLSFTQNDSIDKRFQIIINQIGNIRGNILLIIDNFEKDLNTLNKLISLNNCQIIITTRCILDRLPQYELPILDLESAKKIYYENITREVKTDSLALIDFLKFIEVNPLVIRLCAKTISNSLDIDLSVLFDHLKNQTFDDDDLKIDLYVLEENNPIRILSYLQKTFELRNLTSKEELILEFLSLLPSEDIILDDLAQIGGKEWYKANKIEFINCANSLHQKGWVERDEGHLKMHRLVQEIIKYNTRKKQNGFLSNMFFIVWLTHRIKEVADYDPSISFKYLKYAESILNSIKEPDRKSIYQPLLILENELLNAYQWLYDPQKTHDRWVELTKRAENYLHPDDINLGSIFNNVALSFYEQNDISKAFFYLRKSINVLHKNEYEAVNILITAYNGLSHLYIEAGDLTQGFNCLETTIGLRKKYSLKEDQQIAVQYNIIGFSYLKINNLEKAALFFEYAATAHLKLPEEFRNDFYLVLYYSNLAFTLFKLKEDEKTQIYLEKATLLLATIKLHDNLIIKNIYEAFYLIYEYYGNFEKAKLFREKCK